MRDCHIRRLIQCHDYFFKHLIMTLHHHKPSNVTALKDIFLTKYELIKILKKPITNDILNFHKNISDIRKYFFNNDDEDYVTLSQLIKYYVQHDSLDTFSQAYFNGDPQFKKYIRYYFIESDLYSSYRRTWSRLNKHYFLENMHVNRLISKYITEHHTIMDSERFFSKHYYLLKLLFYDNWYVHFPRIDYDTPTDDIFDIIDNHTLLDDDTKTLYKKDIDNRCDMLYSAIKRSIKEKLNGEYL